MSRIGRQPITVASTANVQVEHQQVLVEGPKGKLSLTLPAQIIVKMDGQQLRVECCGEGQDARALHGLHRALIANMVEGVVNGFSKELEIVGVGYRAQLDGTHLVLQVGFSHPVRVPIPAGITVEVPKPTMLVIRGADKHMVGQFSATIRRVAPPEPYKGKGIKYVGEVIRRKAGKAATGSGAKSS